jgi:hypothetical protein
MNTYEKRHELRKQINQSLSELGDDPDKVAASLHKQGIYGAPDDSRNCPIYNFLCEKGYCIASVSGEHIIVGDKDKEVLYISPSETIESFISSFDSGKYPELEYEDDLDHE